MRTRISRVGVVAVACVLFSAAAAGAADPVPPPTSLNNCQVAVQKKAAAYIAKKESALKGCLNAISKLIIAGQGTDASGAAGTCVIQFRQLSDSRGLGKSLPEKLAAGILQACDPTTNSLPHQTVDVLGPGSSLAQPLDADGIGAWCATFGGNGTILSVQDWVECMTNAAECAVDTAISTQYPRALEWLAAVRPAMEAITPPATDPNKISDALAGLDAAKAAIDGPDNDNVPSVSCGQGGQLLTCQADRTTCTSSLSTCSTDLETCNAGTAAVGDVLSGKTFSGSAGLGGTGTMPDNGALMLTPSTSAQSIPAGYHNGLGSVAGDANLVSGNIKRGISIFGVTGTVWPGQQLKTGQTDCDLGWGGLGDCQWGSPAGQDGALSKGVPRQYADNGDGTINDSNTGLMWEKLDDAGGIHDQDDIYTWYSAFTVKIVTLNSAGGFAGHTDWRLPNSNELQSLVDYGRADAAIDPIFDTGCAASCTLTSCSCTASGLYWSSTTYQYAQYFAWFLDFFDGLRNSDSKDNSHHVRAVRDAW